MILNQACLARTIALPLCLAAGLLFARGSFAGQPLVLNTDGAPPHSTAAGDGFEDKIVREAFRRIGLTVRLVGLPSERALKNAEEGIDDGNYVRVAGLERVYPHLVMVPEPVSRFSFTAFTKNPNVRIASWADLKGRQVAMVTGWKLVEEHLPATAQVRSVRDEQTVLAQLESGRVEVGIVGLRTGRHIAQAMGYTSAPCLPPLAEPPMYLYLNIRHAGLVPKLDAALRQMRQEGLMRTLLEQPRTGAAP